VTWNHTGEPYRNASKRDFVRDELYRWWHEEQAHFSVKVEVEGKCLDDCLTIWQEFRSGLLKDIEPTKARRPMRVKQASFLGQKNNQR
jgi:hypothetical protein